MEQNCFNDIIYKIALCNRSFMHYNKATHKLCFLAKNTESYREITVMKTDYWQVRILYFHKQIII
jgi:hypothetical protein